MPAAVKRSLGTKSDELMKVIERFNGERGGASEPLAGTSAIAGVDAGTPIKKEPRTGCRPVFQPPDMPVNLGQTLDAGVTLPAAEFDREVESLACVILGI